MFGTAKLVKESLVLSKSQSSQTILVSKESPRSWISKEESTLGDSEEICKATPKGSGWHGECEQNGNAKTLSNKGNNPRTSTLERVSPFRLPARQHHREEAVLVSHVEEVEMVHEEDADAPEAHIANVVRVRRGYVEELHDHRPVGLQLNVSTRNCPEDGTALVLLR